jgi:hypothetical protein
MIERLTSTIPVWPEVVGKSAHQNCENVQTKSAFDKSISRYQLSKTEALYKMSRLAKTAMSAQKETTSSALSA